MFFLFVDILVHRSFFLILRRPPRSTLFPYTTLFRSGQFGRRVTAAGNIVVLQSELGTAPPIARALDELRLEEDRKSTRLNSSHANTSYAVFFLKKKKKISKSSI